MILRRLMAAFLLSFVLTLVATVLMSSALGLLYRLDLSKQMRSTAPSSAVAAADRGITIIEEGQHDAGDLSGVVIEAHCERITVIGWDRETLNYAANKHYTSLFTDGRTPPALLERDWISLTSMDGAAHVASHAPLAMADARVGLSLYVPQTMDVRVLVQRSRIDVQHIRGDVEVHITGSGTIRIVDCANTVSARTAIGDVTVENIAAETFARTENGDIHLGLAHHVMAGGRVEGRAVNGDVALSYPPFAAFRCLASTDNGTVEALPPTLGAADGVYQVVGTPADASAAPVVVLRTVNGNIRLRKESPAL